MTAYQGRSGGGYDLRCIRLVLGTGRLFPELDREFHEVLYASLGNDLVPRLLAAFWTVFRRVSGVRGLLDDPSPEITARRHRDIVTALRARDAEGHLRVGQVAGRGAC